MKTIGRFARDTAFLTGASLLMRFIGLAYQVWLSGHIGAAGIGLWQLVTSVSALSATLAISGIRFATTRLISEELGRGDRDTVKAVKQCLFYAGCFGLAAGLILFFGAEAIGFLWIGDARTVKSLRIIAFTMPMISLSSVMNGYFVASGQARKSAAVQVAEQLIGVGSVILLLTLKMPEDLEKSCASVALGNLLADAASLMLVGVLYFKDAKKQKMFPAAPDLTVRMLRIAVPLAFSAYARVGLTTLENLLIPGKLRSAGLSADAALAGYGMITGMVFPIIGFPSCLLSAAAELSIPELTAAQVQGNTARIRRISSGLLKATLAFSMAAAAFLFLCAQPLGRLIYHTDEVSTYIRLLAPLVPVMYMDIVTDGCLKGLGQMLRSMSFNIAEACIGVILVITVLPRWALTGYIFVLYFCELFNFTLSLSRLFNVTGLKPIKKRKHSADKRRSVPVR